MLLRYVYAYMYQYSFFSTFGVRGKFLPLNFVLKLKLLLKINSKSGNAELYGKCIFNLKGNYPTFPKVIVSCCFPTGNVCVLVLSTL